MTRIKLSYDPSNPVDVKEMRALDQLNAGNAIEDLRKILSLPEGRRLIYRILDFCGLQRAAFEPSGSRSYYDNGQRSVGAMLTKDMEDHAFDLYQLMQREHKLNGDI